MTKKIPLSVFVLFFLLSIFCFSIAKGETDQSEPLYRAGNQCEEQKRNEEAKTLYQQVLQQYPDSEVAAGARLHLSRYNVLSLISSGNDTAAQSEIAAIEAAFPNHPDMPWYLYGVANQYEEQKKDDKAKAIYQQILQRYSSTPFAAGAKLHLSKYDVLSRMAAGNQKTLDIDIEKMMADNANHPDMPWFIYYIANQYEELKDCQKAKDYYQKILQKYPDSAVASGAKLHFSRFNVLSQIIAGDESNAEAEIGNIESKFQNHPDLPWYLYGVANQYEEKANYEKAKSVYRKIIQNYSKSPVFAGARIHLSKFEIRDIIDSGDIVAADSEANKIVTGFPNHVDLPCFLSEIADHYKNKVAEGDKSEKGTTYIKKAILLYEASARKANADYAPRMYYCAGECYRKLAEYKKSIDCYLKAVRDYPNYPEAWNAQFMVGRTYEEMLSAGLISESEAKPLITSAYQEVVNKYPNCKAAAAAQNWLNRK